VLLVAVDLRPFSIFEGEGSSSFPCLFLSLPLSLGFRTYSEGIKNWDVPCAKTVTLWLSQTFAFVQKSTFLPLLPSPLRKVSITSQGVMKMFEDAIAWS